MAVTQWIKQNKNLILLFVSVAVLSWAFIIFHEAFHVIGFLLQGESVCVGLNHTASAQGAFYFLIGGLLGPAFTLVIAALAMTVHFFYTKWKTATFVIAVASVVPHFFWSTFIGTLLFVGGNLPQGDALILTLIAPNLEMAKTDAHVLAETLGRSLLIQPWSLVMLWLPLVFLFVSLYVLVCKARPLLGVRNWKIGLLAIGCSVVFIVPYLIINIFVGEICFG